MEGGGSPVQEEAGRVAAVSALASADEVIASRVIFRSSFLLRRTSGLVAVRPAGTYVDIPRRHDELP